ncbi:hypothetical protein FJZ18_04690 [Candidatus Pacearchaeota archaeon]|nr:hypothetical protein [Candidatus Pacearchaeota archaeon]
MPPLANFLEGKISPYHPGNIQVMFQDKNQINEENRPYVNQLAISPIGQHIWSLDGFWNILGGNLRARGLYQDSTTLL